MEPVSTVVCLRCGSVRTRVLAGGLLERCVALALRQQVIACARCGFRGRQPKVRVPRPGGRGRRDGTAQPAEPRIDLAALDRALDADGGPRPPRQGGR